MSVEIKLDATAMDKLFPAGTEARVKLQQAVIQNFANRFINSGLKSELQAAVNLQIKDVIKPAADEFFKNYFQAQYYGSVTLTDSHKLAIRNFMQSEYNKYISDIELRYAQNFKDESERLTKKLLATFDHNIESRINHATTEKIWSHVTKTIQANLENLIQESK